MSIGKSSVELAIKSNSSLRKVTKQINQIGVPLNSYLFEALVRFLGKSRVIKVGIYTIDDRSSPYAILTKITSGNVIQSVITIIEGWTFDEMKAAIDAHPDLLHDTHSLTSVTLLGRLRADHQNPEGLFLPDTYLFPKDSSDFVVYHAAYQAMQNKLKILWEARASDLPLKNQYDALILASLIEKETGRVEERAHIGGVFINRLRMGMPLQTDPAVIYGLKKNPSYLKKKISLRRRDLCVDTPYNTYTRIGLPMTPIALPGSSAINAALHPMITRSLYFVARGDGSSYFSKTLAEHNNAVNKFIRKKK